MGPRPGAKRRVARGSGAASPCTRPRHRQPGRPSPQRGRVRAEDGPAVPGVVSGGGGANRRGRAAGSECRSPPLTRRLLGPKAMRGHAPLPAALAGHRTLGLACERVFLGEFECVRNTAPRCVCKRPSSTESRQMVAGKDAVLSSNVRRCQKYVSKQNVADPTLPLPACKAWQDAGAAALSTQGRRAERPHLAGSRRPAAAPFAGERRQHRCPMAGHRGPSSLP